MTAQTHVFECVFGSGMCPSGCKCGCHEGRKDGAHTPTRKVGPARLTGPRHITYRCTGCEFAITDTGDEVKRVWAKHLRIVAESGEVGA